MALVEHTMVPIPNNAAKFALKKTKCVFGEEMFSSIEQRSSHERVDGFLRSTHYIENKP